MRHLYKNHPLPLLLYLEWSLLAMAVSIVCFALLHNPFLPLPRRLIYANVPKIFNWLSLILVILLGLMGLRLPLKNFLGKILYILGNFALIWLIICLFGRGERIFPPLLLIVVIRSCLMFGWRGRIIVALTAYVSFCTMGLLAFYRIAPLGIPLTRPILPRLRRLQPEITEGLILNWIINSAILFGLALLFVLLLVGTLLAEKKSREKLAQVNHRLRQYALMIEDQATLQERNRIAREIHDSVGHALTAQSIQLENAALFWQKEPEKAKKYLENARHLGKDALKNVRQSVATLRSNPLARRSLPDALSEIIKELQSHTDITVDYKIGILSNLTPEVKNTIYRVI
ncbi:MAG: sensor histidine kinase, partial [Cyanobacteria bacterium J149]